MNEASKDLFSLRNCNEDIISATCAILDEKYEDIELHPLARVWLLLLYELPKRKLSENELGRWHWPLVVMDHQEYRPGYPWLKGDDGGWMLGDFTWRIEGGHLDFEAMHLQFKGLPRRIWTWLCQRLEFRWQKAGHEIRKHGCTRMVKTDIHGFQTYRHPIRFPIRDIRASGNRSRSVGLSHNLLRRR